MNKIIFLALTLTISTTAFAQTSYEAGMKKAFELWENQDAQQATALFERIAQAEPNNWIPSYYAANVLISTSFQTQDKASKMAMLEKAKTWIAAAHKCSPENSEIYTLEGLLYTAYVAMDPPTYAMQYGQKIMEFHQKAITLDEGNPRAQANLIEYEMGTAQWFGQDLKPFCERMQKVIPLFENQSSEVAFAPSYGIERAKQVAASCQ